MTHYNIHWPAQHHPNLSAIHVVNTLVMDVSPHAAWHHLIAAPKWPSWYPNSANVRLLETDSETLKLGMRFKWKTFGVNIECKVEEFEPQERLAWSAKSPGMTVYHAWLISPHPNGCRVFTEETQNGFIPKITAAFMPKRIHKYHQIWLDRLNEIAQSD